MSLMEAFVHQDPTALQAPETWKECSVHLAHTIPTMELQTFHGVFLALEEGLARSLD